MPEPTFKYYVAIYNEFGCEIFRDKATDLTDARSIISWQIDTLEPGDKLTIEEIN